MSRQLISRVERGLFASARIGDVDRIGQALGARALLRLDWNGEALDRLLDEDHARLVEIVVRLLRERGWDVATEVTFAVGVERGSVDVLAHQSATGSVLVVEVKTVVPDLQAMLTTLDRKARLGLVIARQVGWEGRAVGRLLVIADTRTARRRVDAHGETFRVQFPDRIAAIRSWLREPESEHVLKGLWFLPLAGRRDRHRVSRRGPRAGPGR